MKLGTLVFGLGLTGIALPLSYAYRLDSGLQQIRSENPGFRRYEELLGKTKWGLSGDEIREFSPLRTSENLSLYKEVRSLEDRSFYSLMVAGVFVPVMLGSIVLSKKNKANEDWDEAKDPYWARD